MKNDKIKVISAGRDYEELPETYVIFITENDVLQRNLPIYNIDCLGSSSVKKSAKKLPKKK